MNGLCVQWIDQSPRPSHAAQQSILLPDGGEGAGADAEAAAGDRGRGASKEGSRRAQHQEEEEGRDGGEAYGCWWCWHDFWRACGWHGRAMCVDRATRGGGRWITDADKQQSLEGAEQEWRARPP